MTSSSFSRALKCALLSFYAFSILAYASCDSSDLPSLATISKVGPDIIEPGEVLRIEGDGFVEGVAKITLKGKFKPTGISTSKNKTVHFDGTAVSANLIEVPVSSSAMRKITDEQVRFEGKIEASFPSASSIDAVRIVATRAGSSLEFRPTGSGVPLASIRTREAALFMKSMGMIFPQSETGDGLVVKALVQNSSADRAGVEPGDRLLAVNGSALAALGDLSGLPRARSYKFELVSPSGSMREVVMGPEAGAALDPDEFTAIILSSIALGLFLAFCAPTRRSQFRPAEAAKDPFVRAISFAAISVPILLIPAAAVLARAGVGASAALLGTCILGLTGIAVFGRGPISARILSFGAHLMAVPAVLAVAGATGSTVGLWDIVAGQQTSGWGWHVWSSPFALAAVLSSLALLWPSHGSRASQSRVTTIASWLAAVPAAAMLVACCLGGWLVPGVSVERLTESRGLLVLSSLIFFAKTWIVILIARSFAAYGFLERRARARVISFRWRFIALGAAVALTLGWVWFDVPSAYRMTGQVLATAASITFFTVLAIVGLKQVGQSLGKT